MKHIILCSATALALLATPAVQATTAVKKKAPAVKVEAAPPLASSEQVAALTQADMGDFTCEFNEKIKVATHPKYEGYVSVEHRKKIYLMKPVVSSTGAIRLEDLHGQMLMLQIAEKAMLMDTKAGQRLADGCHRPGDGATALAARPG